MAKVQEPESLASYPATLYLDGPALPEEDEDEEEEEEEKKSKKRIPDRTRPSDGIGC
jgi:hypothetical protein